MRRGQEGEREAGRCLVGCGVGLLLLLLALAALAGGAWCALRLLEPDLRARPPWVAPPADPPAAERFEARLGEAAVAAHAGEGTYRLEAPAAEMNAFLRRASTHADTIQVRLEEDGRLALRILFRVRGSPYVAVLRGRVGRDDAGWRVSDASGSIGRVGLWAPAAEAALRRAAPGALESIFPPRIVRLSIDGETVAVEGRLPEAR